MQMTWICHQTSGLLCAFCYTAIEKKKCQRGHALSEVPRKDLSCLSLASDGYYQSLEFFAL